MSSVGLAPAVSPARWAAVTAGSVALVEAGLAWRIGPAAALPAFCCLGAAITVAVVVDARTLKMPNVLLLPSYPIGVALLALAVGLDGRWWPLARAAIAMGAVGGFYLALALAAGGRRLGLADVTLGGLVGLLLGWVGWSALFSGLLLGWSVALVAVVALHATRPRRRVRVVPAGPFLWLGALVAILVAR